MDKTTDLLKGGSVVIFYKFSFLAVKYGTGLLNRKTSN